MNEILNRLCTLVGEQHRAQLKAELVAFSDDVRTAERERWARACEDTASVGQRRFDIGCGWIAPVLQHTRCLVSEVAANEVGL